MSFDIKEGLLMMLCGEGGVITGRGPIIAVEIALWVMTALLAYLLGSVNTSIFVSRTVYRDDVRKHGSGNAGMTNMYRVFGKNAALLTLFGDIAKTLVSMLIGGLLLGTGIYIYGLNISSGGMYVAGLFAVVGHIWPVYYKFKGGKGVLCTATMALTLTPLVFAILFIIFLLVFLLTRFVSASSIAAAVFYPVVLNAVFTVIFGTGSTPMMIGLVSILAAAIIIYCHIPNIKRIMNGEEPKFRFRRDK